MLTQLSEHVYQLPLASPTLLPATTTNLYLIVSDGECLLVDPGYESEENTSKILQTLQKLGQPKLLGIVFTHYHKDHTPGVRGIRKHMTVPVLCHDIEKYDVERVIAPLQVTNTLQHNQQLHIGTTEVRIYHTPGHTHGHIALFIQDDKVLLTGDTVINQGSTWIGPPDGHLRTYLNSLELLKTIPAEKLGPGHGTVIETPMEAIEWFITRRLEREQQIHSYLQSHNKCSVEDLVSYLYTGQVHPSIIWVAEKTVLGHLIKLQEDGKVREVCNTETDIPLPDRQQIKDGNRLFEII